MNHSISTISGKTKLKIVFLGNQAVGKSSIIERYIHDKFDQNSSPTVGIDFLAKNLTHDSKNYRLQLWDTAGQQRFRSLIPGYLKDANCALIVFDVTNANSLNQVQMWVNLYNQNKHTDGYVFLVANKADLDYRQISQQAGLKKAQQLGIPYLQVSAKTGNNLERLFINVLQVCTEKKINPAHFGIKPQDVNLKKNNDIIEVQQKQEGDKVDESLAPIQKNVKKQQKSQKMLQKQTNHPNKIQNDSYNLQQKNDKRGIVLKKQKIQKKDQIKKQRGCC